MRLGGLIDGSRLLWHVERCSVSLERIALIAGGTAERERLGIAQRVVLEISESAPLTLGRACRFGNMLRQLGCVIAIDDFGVAYGIETNIAIDRPDIIKIDAPFRSGTSTDTNVRFRLAGIIRIAWDMSPTVIVEGIGHDADVEHIRDAGALWAQGRCFVRQYPCLV
ncbi:hypothetical protein BGV68_33735 [Burkholderia ubonensis]|uniref:EAL domain-containing protein n=1 Tax=Burkholderia ubonensis TaxID=101571 RepID=UPI0008FE4126|nr:EAL domain-containing protein [Burkholderia ubonensis]OJA43467.1 hypothetical protein BGV68_33735 [Burkholderia ubonensis]